MDLFQPQGIEALSTVQADGAARAGGREQTGQGIAVDDVHRIRAVPMLVGELGIDQAPHRQVVADRFGDRRHAGVGRAGRDEEMQPAVGHGRRRLRECRVRMTRCAGWEADRGHEIAGIRFIGIGDGNAGRHRAEIGDRERERIGAGHVDRADHSRDIAGAGPSGPTVVVRIPVRQGARQAITREHDVLPRLQPVRRGRDAFAREVVLAREVVAHPLEGVGRGVPRRRPVIRCRRTAIPDALTVPG